MKIKVTPLEPVSVPLLPGWTGKIIRTNYTLDNYVRDMYSLNDDTPMVPRVHYLGRKSQVP